MFIINKLYVRDVVMYVYKYKVFVSSDKQKQFHLNFHVGCKVILIANIDKTKQTHTRNLAFCFLESPNTSQPYNRIPNGLTINL